MRISLFTISAVFCLLLSCLSGCNPFDDTAQKRALLLQFVGEWNNTYNSWADGEGVINSGKTLIEANEDGSVSFAFDLTFLGWIESFGQRYPSTRVSDCTIALAYSPEKGGYLLTASSDEWLSVDGLPLEYSEEEGFSGEAGVDNDDVKKIVVSIKAGDDGGYVWSFTGLDGEGEELCKCVHTMETPGPEEKEREEEPPPNA